MCIRDSDKGVPKYLILEEKQLELFGLQGEKQPKASSLKTKKQPKVLDKKPLKKTTKKDHKKHNLEKPEPIVIDIVPEEVYIDTGIEVVKKVVFNEEPPVVISAEKPKQLIVQKSIKLKGKKETPFKTSFQRRNEKSAPVELYNLVNKDLAKFLGNIEIKPKGSLVITLDSRAGGGKTHTTYQVANAFAESGYKPIIWSLEEHLSLIHI